MAAEVVEPDGICDGDGVAAGDVSQRTVLRAFVSRALAEPAPAPR